MYLVTRFLPPPLERSQQQPDPAVAASAAALRAVATGSKTLDGESADIEGAEGD
jgi:hypothetical protein